jgi:hypothetical protein
MWLVGVHDFELYHSCRAMVFLRMMMHCTRSAAYTANDETALLHTLSAFCASH